MRPFQVNSLGRILGGIFGIVLGTKFGALGFFVGLFLGNKLDEALKQKRKHTRVNRKSMWSSQNITLTYQLLGHLAKLDGKVTEQSIHIVTLSMQKFGFDRAQKAQARSAFHAGKDEEFNPFIHMQKLQVALLMAPSLRNAIVKCLVQIVESDPNASTAKHQRLDQILKTIGVIRFQQQHQ